MFSRNLIIGILAVLFNILPSQVDAVEACQLGSAECNPLQCGGFYFSCRAPFTAECDGNLISDPDGTCSRVSGICQDSQFLSLQMAGQWQDHPTIINSEGEKIWTSGPISDRPYKGGVLDPALGNKAPLQCGRGKDGEVFGRWASIRHGRNSDLFFLIGLRIDGRAQEHFARLQDAKRPPAIFPYNRGPLIQLGRNYDVYIQYCFDGNHWTSSEVHRGSHPGEVLRCGKDAIGFFDGGTVQYIPARPAPKVKSDPVCCADGTINGIFP